MNKEIEELAKEIVKTKICISTIDYAMVEILNAETNEHYPFMRLAKALHELGYKKGV